jgi:hypothetical protein
MAVKNDGIVAFRIEVDGKFYDVQYSTEYLREILKKRKETDTKAQFKCIVEGKEYSFLISIEDVKELIKKAERAVELSRRFIPRSLEGYLIDVTQNLSKKEIVPEKGREEEIEKIWSCISKKKNSNAILVGDIDVGKTTTAYEIARQITKNECPVKFTHSRVIMINTPEILKIKKEFVKKRICDTILEFFAKEKKNIVVYVDKLLHMKCDLYLIQLLHKILIEYNIRFIATINGDDYDDYFAEDKSINKYINVIEILEPEPEEIFNMIEKRVLVLQKQYKVSIPAEMVHFAIATASLSNSVSSEPGNVLNVLDRAFSEAKRKGKETVDKQSILSCYNSYLKLYNNTSPEEKRGIAYHEIGHYIMFRKCQNLTNIKIEFVSILPMLDFLGVNHFHTILGEKLNYTKEYFEDMISAYLGGRVGEAKVTDKFSTGASADLECANSCAKKMIMIYGLSEKPNSKNRSYVYNYYYLNDSLMTEKMKEEINDEIQDIINNGFKKAEEIITENLGLIGKLVDELLEKEILSGDELEAICNEYEQSHGKTTE